MKIRAALLKSEAKHGTSTRSKLDADVHGDEMTFEGGILHVRLARGGPVVMWPMASVLWMEPEGTKAKAEKK